MNQQRTIIYGMRKQIMEGKNVERTILDFLGDVTSNILDAHVPMDNKKSAYDLDALNTALGQQFGIKIDFTTFPVVNSEVISDAVSKSVKDTFDRQKKNLGQFFEQIQKMVLLQSIDQRWKEHLARIDRLKEGIGLRGYSGKDPVIEYKKEAFNAFDMLNQTIRGDVVEKLLKVQIVDQEQAEGMQNMLRPPDMDELQFQGAEASQQSSLQAPPRQQQKQPESGGPQRMRMTAGPATPERPMNRADRRRKK